MFTAAGLAAVLLLVGLLVLDPAVASLSKATSLRLLPGPTWVGKHGQVWLSDRAFSRGGRVTSARSPRDRVQRRLRFTRSGPFTYVLPLAPGVYTLNVDAVDEHPGGRSTRVPPVTGSAVRWARHHRVIGRVGRLGVSEFSGTTRLVTGALTLHFGAGCRVTGLTVVRRHPIASPSPGSSTTPAPSGATTSPPSATTTPSSSPGSGVPAGDVTPEDFGAAGNGVTDDTAALQRAFDQASGRTVYLPAGHEYAHSNVLYLRVPGLHVAGPGELLATAEQASSVWIMADNITIDGGVLIKTASTTRRWTTWQQMGVRIDGTSGAVLRDVTVDGSAAAGIYVGGGAHEFVLDHDVVEYTRADGIHMTDGSYDGQVISPTVIESGDDAVAVVSYVADGTICHDIEVTSPVVLGTTGGRGLSVVGGHNITETNIDVERSSAGAVYIAAEGNPWYTAAPTNVTFTGGKIVDANVGLNDDHGAVLVYSDQPNFAPSHVTVSNISITDTRSTVTRDVGVVGDGALPNSILFSNLTITGGPARAYEGNEPLSCFATRNITQNGRLLADLG